VVYWDADGLKDLLVGRGDGRVMIFLNNGTNAAPTFDGGTYLQVGPTGSKVDLSVGSRATSKVADWDSDGRKDLVVGGLDGRIHLFLNTGTDTAPDFVTHAYAQNNGSNLYVPTSRSSPAVVDVDRDGRKDLLSGNTNGQLVYYRNTGTDVAPSFSGYALVEADGVTIDLLGTPRSRPSVCDWTGDGLEDVLIGAYGGNVHLYQADMRITAYCFGDGSSLPCPCGNESVPGSGEGCLNSTGVGAVLSWTGTNLVAPDDLVLHVSQARPLALTVFAQSSSANSIPFYDGLLCMGPPIKRLEYAQIDATGYAATTTSLAGWVAPGDTRYYQAWYRDGTGPCGTAANLSSGLQVDWR